MDVHKSPTRWPFGRSSFTIRLCACKYDTSCYFNDMQIARRCMIFELIGEYSLLLFPPWRCDYRKPFVSMLPPTLSIQTHLSHLPPSLQPLGSTTSITFCFLPPSLPDQHSRLLVPIFHFLPFFINSVVAHLDLLLYASSFELSPFTSCVTGSCQRPS